jgi:hypothetical protein
MVQDIIWKLTVTQLVKKYPAFLWNPKVHDRVHTGPYPESAQGTTQLFT